MIGHLVDTLRFKFKKNKRKERIQFLRTDFGNIRYQDSGGNKPVILNVPDGPNVIEHHQELFDKLSVNYRVVCFEFPGIGFSYPNSKYNYSFGSASELVIDIMNRLNIEKAALAFPCSNGFYGMQTASAFPERITRLFLSQTPSIGSMVEWTKKNIPNKLKKPVLGQLINIFSDKKMAKEWYRFALAKKSSIPAYQEISVAALHDGGCFCLASLMQSLLKEKNASLQNVQTPTTLIWGRRDISHRKTKKESIKEHLPNCEIIQFDDCGHFPELESTSRYVEIIDKGMKQLVH